MVIFHCYVSLQEVCSLSGWCPAVMGTIQMSGDAWPEDSAVPQRFHRWLCHTSAGSPGHGRHGMP